MRVSVLSKEKKTFSHVQVAFGMLRFILREEAKSEKRKESRRSARILYYTHNNFSIRRRGPRTKRDIMDHVNNR